MLEMRQRSQEQYLEPIPGLPEWLSQVLRTRGVDTPEKAERFLHPSLAQLCDPFRMQDMDKACRMIREAVDAGDPILIYGDYDVDGICSTAILMETLQALGARVDFRIPLREEGYGLNEAAVREIARTHRLLITVDCGITNHAEVRLAQSLGMKVIVSDHHELSDTPSPADAALNPLLGTYPFRRLCGAGVALKITQALQGMEGVERALELAALATVADLVPLAEENRVIVREGLPRILRTQRPGLRALLDAANIGDHLNAGHVGFQLAPRLNAGGRLEDAAQCVRLLLTHDEQEAEAGAAHLNALNDQRRAVEEAIFAEAEQKALTETDFLKDRVLIVMGEGWNRGIIGLAAGKLCEKYHFPTIVLSAEGDEAVGSCRSIKGVHIQQMLMACKDLFIRFGGHEMAAGLTIRRELVPELRRRLNLLIEERCDPLCYIPVQEYDATLRLSQVDQGLVNQLEALQPTGIGNPNPLFLTRNAHLQECRPVGRDGSHLKLSVLEGQAVRGGIAFRKGYLAQAGYTRVDLVYTPERNEYRGEVSAQLHVEAMTPSEGSVPLPQGDELSQAVLQEIFTLAANEIQNTPAVPRLRSEQLRALASSGRNLLLIGHEGPRAAEMLARYRLDVAVGQPDAVQAFNTLLFAPELDRLRDCWADIVLIDGDILPGEAAAIAACCPRARLHALAPGRMLPEWLRCLRLDKDQIRAVFIGVTKRPRTLPLLAEDAGLTALQTTAALEMLRQAGLVQYQLAPWQAEPLPWKHRSEEERSPVSTPLYRYLQRL